MSAELRLAVVGCGAVAEDHLRAIADCEAARAVCLVDPNRERADLLARRFDVGEIEADHRSLAGRVDAAILCVPHHLHAPLATDLLESDLPVLVEKPMAMDSAECDRMIAAADRSGAVLAVGQLRRFFRSSIWVRRALEAGMLGEIESFEAREGRPYEWPMASDFTLRRETGGGVLADTGAHLLDLLLWWLGDASDLDYRDDAEGGVEADCRLELTLGGRARGAVELSRTRELANSIVLRGSRGAIEVETRFDSRVRLSLEGLAPELVGGVAAGPGGGAAETPASLFLAQLEDFVAAVRDARPPSVPGAEARRTVALIEACRAHRRPWDLEWRRFVPREADP